MESKKNLDWNRSRPVEHRPYIRDIGGERRFFWITTVVTLAESTLPLSSPETDGESPTETQTTSPEFVAGSTPDIVLTDATYKTTLWVESYDSESWVDELEEKFASVWENN